MPEVVLQKFLAELGWKIDDEGHRRFGDALASTAKKGAEVGEVFLGVATAVEQGVERVARSWQGLYYSSQRLGDTVANVNALGFASSQLGLGDKLVQDVGKFSSALRTQPGLQGFFAGLGTDFSKGATEQFLDTIERLKKMPYPIASQIASSYLGIDPQTLWIYEKNLDQLRQINAENRRVMESYGLSRQAQDEMAKSSQQFMVDLGQLGMRFEALTSIVVRDWLPAGEKVIKWFDDVLDKSKQWSDKQGDNVLGTGHSALDLGGAAAAAGGGVGILALLKRVLGIGAAKRVAKQLLKRGVVSVSEVAEAGLAEEAVGVGLGAAVAAPLAGFAIGMWPGSAGEGEEKYMASRPDLYPDVARKAKDKRVIDFFMKQGYSEVQARGIADNLALESNFDPKARGDHGQAVGIAQWHKDRVAAILKGTGIDVTKAGFDDQLRAMLWELQHTEHRTGEALHHAGTEAEAAEMFSSGYERPLGHRYFRDDKGGGVTVTMNPQVTQHIQGGNAKDTAELVLDGQSRANADVIRNIRGILDATGGR